jgi:hypothetical protein
MKKEIVILATSLKHGNRCVAGKTINTKEWIRPVSNENGDAIELEQTAVLNTRTNKKWPLKLLQKTEIIFSKHVPRPNHQPENFLITSSPWIDKYKIEHSDLQNYLDHPTNLWGLGNSISYQNIPLGCLQSIEASLYLIQVQNLRLYTNQFNGQTRRRASFDYNSVNYDFPVTCLTFDDHIRQNNLYQNAFLCISLGEPSPHDNRCYKLIASIFV